MKKLIIVFLLFVTSVLNAQFERITVNDFYWGNRTETPMILWAGDSQTANDNYARYISQKYYNGIAFADSNVAVSGIQAKYYDSTAGMEIGSLLANKAGINIMVIWIGVNDIASGTSAQLTHSYISAFCNRHRNHGWKIIVATLPSVKTWEAKRDTVNKLIYENWTTYADELADLNGNTYLGTDGQYANTIYFSSDSVHLSLTGYAIAGGIISDAIDRVLLGQQNAEIINSDSIHTRAIYGDTLYGKNLRLTGTIQIPNGTTGAPAFAFTTSPNTGIFSGTGDMTFQSSGSPVLYLGIANSILYNNFVPAYTNLWTLGASNKKWQHVYTNNINVDSSITGTTNLRGQNAFNSTDLTDTVTVANANIADIYFITLTGTVAGVDETPYVEATATGFIVRRNTGTTSGLTYNWLRIK